MSMRFTGKDAGHQGVRRARPESLSECGSQAAIPALKGAWPAQAGGHQQGPTVIRPVSSPCRRRACYISSAAAGAHPDSKLNLLAAGQGEGQR